MSDTEAATETEVADTPSTPDTEAPAPEAQAVDTPTTEAPAESERDTGADEAPSGPAAQAAKYRVRLREAEAARDALAERLNTLQCREVERLAAEHLADSGDLWLAGTNLADLLDEAGNVDPERVTEVVRRVVGSRPHWAAKPKPGQPYRPGRELKSGATLAPPPAGWANLLGRTE